MGGAHHTSRFFEGFPLHLVIELCYRYLQRTSDRVRVPQSFDSHPAKVSCLRISMERQDPQNICCRGLTWGIQKGEWVILVDVYILMELMSLFCVWSPNFCPRADFLVGKSQRFWSDFFTELVLVVFGAQLFEVISLCAVLS